MRVEQEVEDALKRKTPAKDQYALNEEIEAELEEYMDQTDSANREKK